MVYVEIDPEVKRSFSGISLGVSIIRNVHVGEFSSKLDVHVERICSSLKAELTLEGLKDHPKIKAYRSFYWRLGIDPTKQRPAAEALIRRILQGKRFPRINCAVDAINLASALNMIPLAAYDFDRIIPPIILRWSRNGEKFRGIGENVEHEIQRQLVLADNTRIVGLYPHRDSYYTRITGKTKNIIIISCGIPYIAYMDILRAAESAAENIVKLCGGEAISINLVK